MGEIEKVQQGQLIQIDEVTERVLMAGDLAQLNPAQRLNLVRSLCDAMGLDMRLRPFEYITFQGKLILYARKACSDQLRDRRSISIEIVKEDISDGVYTVYARATMPNGRSEVDVGAVSIGAVKGDALAIAKMKAVTKAKRRVTLGICGLGMLDESEIEDAEAVRRPRVGGGVEEAEAPAPVVVDPEAVKAWAADLEAKAKAKGFGPEEFDWCIAQAIRKFGASKVEALTEDQRKTITEKMEADGWEKARAAWKKQNTP